MYCMFYSLGLCKGSGNLGAIFARQIRCEILTPVLPVCDLELPAYIHGFEDKSFTFHVGWMRRVREDKVIKIHLHLLANMGDLADCKRKYHKTGSFLFCIPIKRLLLKVK